MTASSRRRGPATAITVVAGLLAAGLTACSSAAPHRGPTAYSDVNGASNPGIASQHIAQSAPVTLQAGDVCTKGTVRIRTVEPVTVKGRLLVSAWGTRPQRDGDEGGDKDPASAHVTLASLGGFTHDAFSQPCGAAVSAHRELDIEVRAGTSAARATGFRVVYDGGRTFTVPLDYARCTAGVTAKFTCDGAKS